MGPDGARWGIAPGRLQIRHDRLLQHLFVLEGVDSSAARVDARLAEEASGDGAGEPLGMKLGTTAVQGRRPAGKNTPTQLGLGWPWGPLGPATASDASLTSLPVSG